MWPGVLHLKQLNLGEKLLLFQDLMVMFMIRMEFQARKLNYMLELRASNEDIVKPYSYAFEGVEFHEGKHPWEVKVDIALPCATQNELKR